MANPNYDLQKRDRERAKLAKKQAKARDRAAAVSNAKPVDEPAPESEPLDPAH